MKYQRFWKEILENLNGLIKKSLSEKILLLYFIKFNRIRLLCLRCRRRMCYFICALININKIMIYENIKHCRNIDKKYFYYILDFIFKFRVRNLR